MHGPFRKALYRRIQKPLIIISIYLSRVGYGSGGPSEKKKLQTRNITKILYYNLMYITFYYFEDTIHVLAMCFG